MIDLLTGQCAVRIDNEVEEERFAIYLNMIGAKYIYYPVDFPKIYTIQHNSCGDIRNVYIEKEYTGRIKSVHSLVMTNYTEKNNCKQEKNDAKIKVKDLLKIKECFEDIEYFKKMMVISLYHELVRSTSFSSGLLKKCNESKEDIINFVDDFMEREVDNQTIESWNEKMDIYLIDFFKKQFRKEWREKNE